MARLVQPLVERLVEATAVGHLGERVGGRLALHLREVALERRHLRRQRPCRLFPGLATLGRHLLQRQHLGHEAHLHLPRIGELADGLEAFRRLRDGRVHRRHLGAHRRHDVAEGLDDGERFFDALRPQLLQLGDELAAFGHAGVRQCFHLGLGGAAFERGTAILEAGRQRAPAGVLVGRQEVAGPAEHLVEHARHERELGLVAAAADVEGDDGVVTHGGYDGRTAPERTRTPPADESARHGRA